MHGVLILVLTWLMVANCPLPILSASANLRHFFPADVVKIVASLLGHLVSLEKLPVLGVKFVPK